MHLLVTLEFQHTGVSFSMFGLGTARVGFQIDKITIGVLGRWSGRYRIAIAPVILFQDVIR